MDLSSMDLETALMTVQTQRSQLLEATLKQQLDTVNSRNQQIAGLSEDNSKLAATNSGLDKTNADMTGQIAELKDLQGRLAASKCPDPEGFYGLSWGQGDDPALSYKTLDQIKDAGLTIPTGADAPRNVDGNGTMDAKGRVVQGWVDQINTKVAELEAKISTNTTAIDDNKNAIASNKSTIDSLGNTQQMEMLRLQSLTGKRNEAFETMTNFLKKMQDSRSSIIGNMR
ncbi:hypothetical protein KW845_19725 [Bordetella sp. BOR01]|nr:hypothetical protein [Bordetella sp. BOR01]